MTRYNSAMDTVKISQFKAQCIAMLKQVQKTRKPLLVTLRGEPLVEVVPAGAGGDSVELGKLRGCIDIKKDLVQTDFDEEWEMLE